MGIGNWDLHHGRRWTFEEENLTAETQETQRIERTYDLHDGRGRAFEAPHAISPLTLNPFTAPTGARAEAEGRKAKGTTAGERPLEQEWTGRPAVLNGGGGRIFKVEVRLVGYRMD